MNIYIPEKLNLSKHIEAYPPQFIPKFTEAKLAFILSQINVVKSTKRDVMDDEGFVHLNSSILQSLCREANLYYKYAIETEIILWKDDYCFEVGRNYSRSYRFHPKYDGKSQVYKPVNFYVPKQALLHQGSRFALKGKYAFIEDAYDSGNIIFYADEAEDFFQRQLDYYLANSRQVPKARRKTNYYVKAKSNDELYKLRSKDPYDIFNTAMYHLHLMKDQAYFAFLDDAGRCYHPLVGMPSLMRNFLAFGDEHLVSVDISNSQPYIFLALLNPCFYDGLKNFEKLPNLLSCGGNITDTLEVEGEKVVRDYKFGMRSLSEGMWRRLVKDNTDYNTITNLVNRSQTYNNEEIRGYYYSTTTGTLYKEVQEGLVTNVSPFFQDIGQVKVEWLRFFFSTIDYIDPAKQWCMNKFPNINAIANFYKKYGKRNFAILLQAIESKIMLDRVAKRIAKHSPDLFILPIHDCLVTTVGNEKYVAQVIKEEFARCIGTPPNVKYEYYGPKNAKLLKYPFYKPF